MRTVRTKVYKFDELSDEAKERRQAIQQIINPFILILKCFYNMNTKILKFRVVYFFKHSKMGFSNSVTVEAINPEQAKEKAMVEISGCYGTSMLKRFSLKEAIAIH